MKNNDKISCGSEATAKITSKQYVTCKHFMRLSKNDIFKNNVSN